MTVPFPLLPNSLPTRSRTSYLSICLAHSGQSLGKVAQHGHLEEPP